MTKIVITAEEVPPEVVDLWDELWDKGLRRRERFAAVASNEAFQRLVVRKCVEGMSEDCEVEGCVCLTAFGIPVFVTKEELLAALCPTPDQGEG